MPDGFTIDLNEAEKGCRAPNGSLPQASLELREPVADLFAFEGWHGTGTFDAADRIQVAFRSICETLGERQIRACDTMDRTAEALRDIIALYRRVDGQD